MAVADAQAHYDPLGGETTGYISPQDAKNAIAQIYIDMAATDGAQDIVINAKVNRSGDTMTGQLVTIAPVASGDAANKGYVDSVVGQHMPLGAIIMWGAATAPSGWHLCDGTAHGSSALQTIIGSSTTPDLRSRFVVGAGSTYAVGNTGGVDSVTLSAAQSGSPAHNHTASATTTDINHTHTGTTGDDSPDHIHTMTGWREPNLFGNTGARATFASLDSATGTYGMFSTGGASARHQHGFTTGYMNQSNPHGHTITVNNSSAVAASASHENRPPYYALTFIIKKV